MAVENEADETPGLVDAEPEEPAADADEQPKSAKDDDRLKAYQARDKAKEEARKAAKELRGWKEKAQALERQKLEAEGNLAKILEHERLSWAEQKAEYETQLQELMSERNERLKGDRESQFLRQVADAAGLSPEDAKLARWALLDAQVDIAPESFGKREINAAVNVLSAHAPKLMKPKAAADVAAPAPGQNLRIKPHDERPATSARERVIANAKALSELSRGQKRRL